MSEAASKRGIVIELIARHAGADFSKIAVDIANGQCVDLSDWEVVQHISLIDDFRAEFIEYVARHGTSSLLNREPLFEALIAKGATAPIIVPLLHGFLRALGTPTDLVIVDPYFLASGPAAQMAAYPALVVQVLQPVLATLNKLTIITFASKVDPGLSASVTAALAAAAPGLTVAYKTSDAFHDRFWVDPLAGNGFITGSSLNGLGKRYALVERLQQQDAADVISALRTQQLL